MHMTSVSLETNDCSVGIAPILRLKQCTKFVSNNHKHQFSSYPLSGLPGSRRSSVQKWSEQIFLCRRIAGPKSSKVVSSSGDSQNFTHIKQLKLIAIVVYCINGCRYFFLYLRAYVDGKFEKRFAETLRGTVEAVFHCTNSTHLLCRVGLFLMVRSNVYICKS